MKLGEKQEDGVALQVHLEKYAEKKGKSFEEVLVEFDIGSFPDFPLDGAFVWKAYFELHNRREWTQLGPTPISWSSFNNWEQTNKIKLTGSERDLIFKLDSVFLNSFAEKQ